MSGESKVQYFSRVIDSSDEIDFFELLELLWRQKVLISFFVSLGLGVALTYAYSVNPIYQSSIVIGPPSVAGFGGLARAVNEGSTSKEKYVLGQAVDLSEKAIEILKRNLMSAAVQQEFQSAYSSEDSSLSMVVSEERGRCKQITQLGCYNVVISALGNVRLTLKPLADAYLGNVAALTAVEVNQFLGGMGVGQRLEATDLYRIENAASIPEAPIKPRKQLILALGVALGGMFGVFVALVRGVLKRRNKQVI